MSDDAWYFLQQKFIKQEINSIKINIFKVTPSFWKKTKVEFQNAPK
jgi:hypothetical protein